MDTEINCDSDVSDSWCVVDTTNEIGNCMWFDGNELQGCDKNGSVAILETTKETCKNITEIGSEQEDAIKHSKNEKFNETTNSTSHDQCQTDKCKNFQVLYQGKGFDNGHDIEEKPNNISYSISNTNGTEKVAVDSKFEDIDGDTDGISVISESECNDIRISAYETDEIPNERFHDNQASNKIYSNALKRKRKRLKFNHRESSEESVGSDFMFPEGRYYTYVQNLDIKKNTDDFKMDSYGSTPVYRHYRNNVANSVLSLAVGIIFAGVACIALGHFLGVHDAQHPAGEMMETLKRLQMENMLLQSRLAHLSKAFFSRGNKLDTKANDEIQNCVLNSLGTSTPDIHKYHFDILKKAEFVPMKSSHIGVGFRETPRKLTDTKFYKWDGSNQAKQAHGKEDFFSISPHNDIGSNVGLLAAPVIQNQTSNDSLSLAKYAKQLKGIFFKDEIFYGIPRVITPDRASPCNLKNKISFGSPKKQNCLAVRENDLSKFRWFIIQEKKNEKVKSNAKPNGVNPLKKATHSTLLYKFPQPEEYYRYEEVFNSSSPHQVMKRKLKNVASSGLKLDIQRENYSNSLNFTRVKSDLKRKIKKFNYKTPKKMKNYKKAKKEIFEMKPETESWEKESNRRSKLISNNKKFAVNNYKNHLNPILKLNKKSINKREIKKNRKLKERSKENNNRPDFLKDSKDKRKYRKIEKKPDFDKPMAEKLRFWNESLKENNLKSKGMRKNELNRQGNWSKQDISSHEKAKVFSSREYLKFSKRVKCQNTTYPLNAQSWIHKWADGRERYRRNKKISDWQFDRARSREERRGGDMNWQFSRAIGREFSRNGNTTCFVKTKSWIHKWEEGCEKGCRHRKVTDWQFDRAKSREKLRGDSTHWQFNRGFGREPGRSEAGSRFYKKYKYS